MNLGGLQKANWMRSSHFLRVLRAAGRIDGTAGNAPAVASQSTEGNLSVVKGWRQTRGSVQAMHQRSLNAWVEALSRVPGLDPQVSAVASREGNRRARCLSRSTNKDIGGPED